MKTTAFARSSWMIALPLAILSGFACGNETRSGGELLVPGGGVSGGASSASGGAGMGGTGGRAGVVGTGGVGVSTGGGSTGGGTVTGSTGGNAAALGGTGGVVGSAGGNVGVGGSVSASGGTSGSGGGGTGGGACAGGLEVLSTVLLDADGPGGVDTYMRIYDAFGPAAIEAPDLYAINHPAVPHILEASDGTVGNHFVFKIHRDDDWDRDTGATDRQRNEIKTYDGSAESLKARLAETFLITWKFKIDAAMPVSKNFSHFFQLKAVGGDDSHPLVTITGAKKGNGTDIMEIRQADSAVDQVLGSTSWTAARGQWLEASVLATFTDTGSLKLTIKTLDGTVLIDVDRTNLDLWRAGDFVRPKWGIYRSLADSAALRPEEDTVLFANFSVSKVRGCPAN
ncbi:MAG: hypothetical protein SFV15_13565 [Polyangiaceae bacterium]|nr:hypothetical protein [Polyangiaceae bacterium]